MTTPGHRKGTAAPIAEPEEVTDVSRQASTITLEHSPDPADRDEPDVQVHFGPERLRQPLSALRRNVRRLWRNSSERELERGKRVDLRADKAKDSWLARFRKEPRKSCRMFRHHFCPPYRVAGDDSSLAQESELMTDR